mmetsp:Transcript_6767/g.14901  ORF Transcript_6767/g.14901 Transcript_6767/m.14901 type:complete len:107 (-) Transcript_6767:120-440(-)
MSSPTMLAHRVRVQNLYRHAIKLTHNWCIDRDVLIVEATKLRAQFDEHKKENNFALAQQLCADGEAQLVKYQHPDPYIQPYMPGGTKWQRNTPVPTELLENPYISH